MDATAASTSAQAPGADRERHGCGVAGRAAGNVQARREVPLLMLNPTVPRKAVQRLGRRTCLVVVTAAHGTSALPDAQQGLETPSAPSAGAGGEDAPHRGLSIHQYALPGRPASHACVRMLERDAQWLFESGETWTLDDRGWNVLDHGTPVPVVGC